MTKFKKPVLFFKAQIIEKDARIAELEVTLSELTTELGRLRVAHDEVFQAKMSQESDSKEEGRGLPIRDNDPRVQHQPMTSKQLKDQLHYHKDKLKDEVLVKKKWKDMSRVGVRRNSVLEARDRELARRGLDNSQADETSREIEEPVVVDEYGCTAGEDDEWEDVDPSKLVRTLPTTPSTSIRARTRRDTPYSLALGPVFISLTMKVRVGWTSRRCKVYAQEDPPMHVSTILNILNMNTMPPAYHSEHQHRHDWRPHARNAEYGWDRRRGGAESVCRTCALYYFVPQLLYPFSPFFRDLRPRLYVALVDTGRGDASLPPRVCSLPTPSRCVAPYTNTAPGL
ncbi:hypothetical protein B0H16DRAFT_1730887 [Mycena metata]|uniref:Uncharacterized protein n=1 Tax=Mycena metata TaxID=1033252 RepID=A0AAD7I6M6_9AGAR|nr:hypothetical protein B0H16DRAFT_1730887 [Mycena metata]